jgi:hypothetical protein
MGRSVHGDVREVLATLPVGGSWRVDETFLGSWAVDVFVSRRSAC